MRAWSICARDVTVILPSKCADRALFARDRVERIETHAAGSDAALADLAVSRLGARA